MAQRKVSTTGDDEPHIGRAQPPVAVVVVVVLSSRRAHHHVQKAQIFDVYARGGVDAHDR